MIIMIKNYLEIFYTEILKIIDFQIVWLEDYSTINCSKRKKKYFKQKFLEN